MANNNTPLHEYNLRIALKASQAKCKVVLAKYGYRNAVRYHYLYGKHHPHDSNHPITDWDKV